MFVQFLKKKIYYNIRYLMLLNVITLGQIWTDYINRLFYVVFYFNGVCEIWSQKAADNINPDPIRKCPLYQYLFSIILLTIKDFSVVIKICWDNLFCKRWLPPTSLFLFFHDDINFWRHSNFEFSRYYSATHTLQTWFETIIISNCNQYYHSKREVGLCGKVANEMQHLLPFPTLQPPHKISHKNTDDWTKNHLTTTLMSTLPN